MIFVTVGTELAFDRLIRPIDEWAGREGRTDVFAQIGPSSIKPRHIRYVDFLDALECRQRIADAQVVIAHAGMGTILLAREFGKPILVMPRREALNEHRTDHQMGTVRELAARGSVVPVMNEAELLQKLQDIDRLPQTNPISPYAPPDFIDRLRNFIAWGSPAVAVGSVIGTNQLDTAAPFIGVRQASGRALAETRK